MLGYVYHAIESFRSVFSRQRSWLLFATVVLSFPAAPEMVGVTSMCRFWLGDERGYHGLLHFFRSKAYCYDALLGAWQRYVSSQETAVEVKGFAIWDKRHPPPRVPARAWLNGWYEWHWRSPSAMTVLDAFFSTGGVFRLARSMYSIALKQPYSTILTRAKKHYVAYFPAGPKPPGRRGPQPRYGEKVSLMECFDHPQLFHTVDCHVYGKREAVRAMSLQLLWKPLRDWLLFIFAITSRGPIMLMCSDLTLSPSTAIEFYCVRTRIEIMFDVMKIVSVHSVSTFGRKNCRATPAAPRPIGS